MSFIHLGHGTTTKTFRCVLASHNSYIYMPLNQANQIRSWQYVNKTCYPILNFSSYLFYKSSVDLFVVHDLFTYLCKQPISNLLNHFLFHICPFRYWSWKKLRVFYGSWSNTIYFWLVILVGRYYGFLLLKGTGSNF